MKRLLSIFNRKAKRNDEIPVVSDPTGPVEQKDIALWLGDTIVEVRTHFEYRGVDNWLDTNISFLKLEKNGMVCFPFAGDDTFQNVAYDHKAQPILDSFQQLIYGRKITDIYYLMDPETNGFEDAFGFIVLDNGYVLEEERMYPSGARGADMFCKPMEEFEAQVLEAEAIVYSVRTKSKRPDR